MVSKHLQIWSGSWFFTHSGSRILDPGVKKAPDPGSESATLEPTENKYRTRITSVRTGHRALKFCTFAVIRIDYFIHTWRLSDLKRMSRTTRRVSLEILRLSSVWRWRMSTRDCRGRVARWGLLHKKTNNSGKWVRGWGERDWGWLH